MDKHNEPNNDINNSNKLTANTAMLTANTESQSSRSEPVLKISSGEMNMASINKNNINK